jgi:pimeloyl-ACP methyl ester carboxylesterase
MHHSPQRRRVSRPCSENRLQLDGFPSTSVPNLQRAKPLRKKVPRQFGTSDRESDATHTRNVDWIGVRATVPELSVSTVSSPGALIIPTLRSMSSVNVQRAHNPVPPLRARRFARALLGTAAACFWSLAAAGAQSEGTVASDVYVHPQQLVAIEGARRINLYCQGAGEPTVLFDAGAGENMMVWRHVQGQIAAVTRACSYDRAGYGFSDSATRASDARNAVDDLHRLLRAAGINKPIVYVGHSAAGLYGTLLVATYPRDVAGAVLVDPAFAHSEQRMTAAFQPADRAKLTNAYAGVLGFIRGCVELAQSGALAHPLTKDASACVDTKGYRDDIDDTLRHELVRQYAKPRLLAAALSEYGSLWPGADMTSVDDHELDAAHLGFGDRPLVVLIHDGSSDPPPPGFTPAQRSSMETVRVASLTALAQTSTHGTHIVVQKAAHHIQFDQPHAVIAAVRRVVEDVRHGSSHASLPH